MYMSYCRFEGALQEMRACMNDVIEHVDEKAKYPISEHEIECFKKMVHEFLDFLEYDLEVFDIDNDGCGFLHEKYFDDVCEAMTKGYDEEEEE